MFSFEENCAISFSNSSNSFHFQNKQIFLVECIHHMQIDHFWHLTHLLIFYTKENFLTIEVNFSNLVLVSRVIPPDLRHAWLV